MSFRDEVKEALSDIGRQGFAWAKQELREALRRVWHEIGEALFAEHGAGGSVQHEVDMELPWSPWMAWADVDREDGVLLPSRAGVYEVKRRDEDGPLLHIGKADILQRRCQEYLVRRKGPHSAGERMYPVEDINNLVVRWAETDDPLAVEGKLHRRHVAAYGRLPLYTRQSPPMEMDSGD